MTTLLQRSLRPFASTLGGQFATESPGQLLRIIQSSISLNRSLISKFWKRYERPALIFLSSIAQENTLTIAAQSQFLASETINKVKNCHILYLGIEQDVLWIDSNHNML